MRKDNAGVAALTPTRKNATGFSVGGDQRWGLGEKAGMRGEKSTCVTQR